MPGSKIYQLHVIIEKIQKYFYFGDFGQILYNIKESDKYLVEAKVLFEYKQYLLGLDALNKSNAYFMASCQALKETKQEDKDISEKQKMLIDASTKHKEILLDVKNAVPKGFNWSPEKNGSTSLKLWSDIDVAIIIRKGCI